MARVFSSAECLGHPGMPEQPARIQAVWRALEREQAPGVNWADSASEADLEFVHPPEYIEHLVRAASERRDGGVEVPLVPASWAAVLGAAGAVLAATRIVVAEGGCAIAAVRPPGHHATRDVASGFCPINLVALAREWARPHGVERALIVDWDVHHGNGTQAIFEQDATTRFVSMHQHPHYPGTGHREETGVGNVTNLPLPPGLPRHEYREALWSGIERATRDFTPDLILISAGYDSLAGDPLGGFTLEPEDCADWVTRMQERWPDVPMLATMEGGYLPQRLAEGVIATVQAMR